MHLNMTFTANLTTRTTDLKQDLKQEQGKPEKPTSTWWYPMRPWESGKFPWAAEG